VFSMDGDIAPLPELVDLAEKYDAAVMVDDAHGTGVLGEQGKGAAELLGVEDRIDVLMGTLSKALGCFGAFAAGKKDLISLLLNRSRSFIYSTSLPPAVADAGHKAIDIIDSRSVRLRKRLWKNRERLHEGLQELGFDTLDSETPIIPVLIGDINKTLKLGKHLHENKIFAPAIRPPTVPDGKCRIRFTVTAGHTDEDIGLVLEVMKKARGK